MYQQHLTLLSRFILQCCQWQHNSVSAVRQDVAVLIPVTVFSYSKQWRSTIASS